MKKIFLICLLGFLCLVACQSSPPPTVENISLDRDNAIYEFVSGEVANVAKVSATTSDGETYTGEVTEGEFQVAVPASNNNQVVNINFVSEAGENLGEEIEISSRPPIDEYESFANVMNNILERMDAESKVTFPNTLSDGINKFSFDNEIEASANVSDGNIIGLELKWQSDVHSEIEMILVSFQHSYSEIKDTVFHAYANTIHRQDKNSTTSDGYEFMFDCDNNSKIDYYYADIFKTIE